MDWRVVSMGPFFMWALYAVFGSLANKAHGENVTMVFEAGAMVLVAGVALIMAGLGDFGRVTTSSMTYAVIMGLMSALGVLVQFYAFRIAPVDQQGTVAMLGGMYPILAVILFYGMYVAGISGGSVLVSRQWLGVVFGAIALWLVSGK